METVDVHSKDRSYQFGRLMAYMEKAERDEYKPNIHREPNAIRHQSAFARTPMRVAQRVSEMLSVAYLPRLKPGLRKFYQERINSVFVALTKTDDYDPDKPFLSLNAPLTPAYLIGYALQRQALYQKKNKSKNTDGKSNMGQAEQDQLPEQWVCPKCGTALDILSTDLSEDDNQKLLVLAHCPDCDSEYSWEEEVGPESSNQ